MTPRVAAPVKRAAKKAAKKSTPAKASSKQRSTTTGRRPRPESAAPAVAQAGPIAEIFSVNGPDAEKPLPRGTVQLLVSGRDMGQKQVGGLTVRQFVTEYASQHGIRNFSVYIDGDRANTGVAERPASEVAVRSIEIVPKDQRGADGGTGDAAERAEQAHYEQLEQGGPSGSPDSSDEDIPQVLQDRIFNLASLLTREQREELFNIISEVVHLTGDRLTKVFAGLGGLNA